MGASSSSTRATSASSFKVEGGQLEAVRDVSFQLHKGETIALVGESGSGKSVTARTVMGLLGNRATVAKRTRITFNGDDIVHYSEKQKRALRGNQISMIFQEPMSSLNPIYTVGQQICEILHLHNRISHRDAIKRAAALLEEVQIPEPAARLRSYPHQMSGGQRQRVMIAMALANRPDLLIADEPTTALDVTVQAQILQLIKDLKARYGMAVIMITHDLTIVRAFSQYVYVMKDGEVKEHNRTEEDLLAPRSHPYTQHLLASEPKGVANPLAEDTPTILDGRGVNVVFKLKRGGIFKPDFFDLTAVDHLDINLRRHETLGLVGESGSGKTTFGQALIRLIGNDGGHDQLRRRADRDQEPQGNAPAALAHADRLPGPIRLAQSAHVDPADHRGRTDRQPYRPERQGAPPAGAPGARRCRHAGQHPVALPA